METIQERERERYMSAVKPSMDPPQTSTNTYRIGPDDAQKFPVIEGRQMVENVLEERLSGFQYDAKSAGDVCKGIADAVTSRAKHLGCDRHRFICHAAMFSKVGQAVKSVSRFLWDQKSDNHVTCTYESKDFSVAVSLYALYFE